MNQKTERQEEKSSNIKEPSGGYSRNKEPLTFFGQPVLKGEYASLDPEQLKSEEPALFYSHPNGEIRVGDATRWLSSLEPESVDLIFANLLNVQANRRRLRHQVQRSVSDHYRTDGLPSQRSDFLHLSVLHVYQAA